MATAIVVVGSVLAAVPVGARAIDLPDSKPADAPLVCDGDEVPFFIGPVYKWFAVGLPTGTRLSAFIEVDPTGSNLDGTSHLSFLVQDLTRADEQTSSFHTLHAETVGPGYEDMFSDSKYPNPPTETFGESRDLLVRLGASVNPAHGRLVVDIEGAGAVSTVLCRLQKLLGAAESHGSAGDPANTATGNVTDARVDVAARPGTSGPVAERFYNSQDSTVGLLGRGWTSGYEARLYRVWREDPDDDDALAPPERSDVVFRSPTGLHADFFYNPTTDAWTSPPGVNAVLSWSSDHYELAWPASGEVWVFDTSSSGDPDNYRLGAIEYPSTEVVDLTWGNDSGTTATELLYAKSSQDPTVFRWLDANADDASDELWVDTPASTASDPTVNYLYETDGSAPNLHDVTVVHADDSSGGEPWGSGHECEAPYPCETYESEDPREPASSDFPWITRIVDATGYETLRNTYAFTGPHRVVASGTVAATASWWPEIDDLAASGEPVEVRSHLIQVINEGSSISGSFSVTVDSGTPHTGIAWNASASALQTALQSDVADTTVTADPATTADDGWYRIVWGDGATHTVAVGDSISPGRLVDHKDLAPNDDAAWVTPVFDAAAAGATVTKPIGQTPMFDIRWPSIHPYGLSVSTAGVTSGTITASVVDTAPNRRMRIRQQHFATGDTVSFTYDLSSDFLYGPSNTLEAVFDTEVIYDDGTTSETVLYHHDAGGRLVGVTDPNDEAVDRSYDTTTGRLAHFEDRGGATVNRTFDSAGRVTSEARSDPGATGDAATSYTAYEGGRPSIHIDAAGATTTFDYGSDPDRRIPYRTWVCDKQETAGGTDGLNDDDECPPSGPYTQIELTAVSSDGVDGLVETVTEPVDQTGNQVATTYLYDADATETYANCGGRQLCGISIAGDVTRYEYDPVTGLVARVEDPVGNVTVNQYDPAGRLTRTFDPIAWADYGPDSTFNGTHYAVEYGHDAAGRVRWISDEANPYTGGSGAPTIEHTYTADGEVERTLQHLTIGQACAVTGGGVPYSDADCTVTVNDYDSTGRLASVTVADDGDTDRGAAEDDSIDEATTFYSYGPLGRLTATVDPVGVETHFCYDANGNQTHRIVGDTGDDPCADLPSDGYQVWATVHDTWGRVACEADPQTAGVIVSGELDPTPTCGEWTDYTAYTYDAAGRVLTSVRTGASGTTDDLTTTHTYDARGSLTGTFEPRGYSWGTSWTKGGESVSATGSIEVEHRTYYPSGRLATIVAPPAGVFTYSGDLTSATDRLTTTYEYNTRGLVASVTDPKGYVTSSGYDDAGRLTTTTDAATTADAFTTTNRYDGLGRVIEAGRQGPWGFIDIAGTATGGTWSVQVDGGSVHGGLAPGLAVTGATSLQATLAGDVSGTTVTGTAGDRYEITWGDGDTHTLTVTSSLTGATVAAYDGTRQARTYTPTGQLASETDYAIDPTTAATRDFGYNAAGWLTASSDAAYTGSGYEVTYVHNLRGDRTSRCANPTGSNCSGGVLDRWVHDRAGRVTCVLDTADTVVVTNGVPDCADGGTVGEERLAYDGQAPSGTAIAGRLWSTTDATGRVHTTTWDANDYRPTSEAYTGTGVAVTVNASYDAFGRRTQSVRCEGSAAGSCTTSNGDVTNSLYDQADRLIETNGPKTPDTARWAWDLNGDLRQLQYPSGAVVRWRTDKNRLVEGVDGWVPFGGSGAWVVGSTYTFNRLDQPLTASAADAGPMRRQWTYGADGRVSDYFQCFQWVSSTCTQSNYHDQDLTWRPDGRLASDSTRLQGVSAYRCRTYSYLADGQLDVVQQDASTACGSSPSLGALYDYDYTAIGNIDRICKNATFSACSGGTLTDLSYDARGGIDKRCDGTTLPTCSGGTLTDWSIDAAGRVASATQGFVVVNQDFDSTGAMTSIDIAGASPSPDYAFGYDADGRLADYTIGTGSAHDIVWDPNQAVPQALTVSGVEQSFGPHERIATPNHWYATDAAGNHVRKPSAVSGNDGTFPNHPDDYTPFGEPLYNHSQTVQTDFFGYRGELHLFDFIHLRARTYDPRQGNFLSADPVDGHDGTPDIANPYDYVGNDPLNFTDPTGLNRQDDADPIWEWPLLVASACTDSDTLTVCPRSDDIEVDNPWIFPDPWFVWSEVWDWLNGEDFLFAAITEREDLIVKTAFDYDDPDEGDTVYRVHDGTGRAQFGDYWTPIDPEDFERSHFPGAYRFFAGLPDGNMGTRLVEGRVKDASAVREIRPALALPTARPINIDGYNIGGMPEWIIPTGCNNPGIDCGPNLFVDPPF